MAPLTKPPSTGGSPDAARQERETLLRELGALVYDLHRQGRREPELLQAKASALDAVDARLRDAGTEQLAAPCPECHADTIAGQLVCLECGHALEPGDALEPGQTLEPGAGERPGRRAVRRVATALAALVAVAAAGLGALALTGEGDGDREPAAVAPAKPKAESRNGKGDKNGETAGVRETGPTAAESAPGEPAALLPWPSEVTGFTVALLTSADEEASRRAAWGAARSGLEAGLLDPAEHAGLGDDMWIVFAGRYTDQASAEQAAEGLAERFPGAYVQAVQPPG